MSALGRLQNLPERTKKIILWIIVVVIGLGLLTLWIKGFQEKLKNFELNELQKELKLPSFGEEMEKLPKINEE